MDGARHTGRDAAPATGRDEAETIDRDHAATTDDQPDVATTEPLGVPDEPAGTPTIEQAGPVPEAPVLRQPAGERRQVLLVDTPEARVRRPRDLIDLVVSLLGIGVVLLLAVYAHGTTQGVTEDVQLAAARLLRQILLIPVTVLEGLVTLFLPIVVLGLEFTRRRWRTVLVAVAAAVAAWLVTSALVWLLELSHSSSLASGLTISQDGVSVIVLSPFTAALAALLTTTSTRAQRRSVRWSWTLLWVVLGLSVIRGAVTLPGAVAAILLGRAIGLGTRYLTGVRNRRAGGVELVNGMRRAGIDPVTVVRVDVSADDPHLSAWRITTSAPFGHTERTAEARRGMDALATPASADGRGGTPPDGAREPGLGRATIPRRPDVIVPDVLTDPHVVLRETRTDGTTGPGTARGNRSYAVRDVEGRQWCVTVLDGDRQVVGYLTTVWNTLRMPSVERRRAASLRTAAEHAALMRHSVVRAGVRTPALEGVAEAEDSVLLVSRELQGARQLTMLPPEEITDGLLAAVWTELRRAHRAGLVHRDLTPATILVDPAGDPHLLGWESGEIASSELTRVIDTAQLLTLTAHVVGTERALRVARQSLGTGLLATVAPLLQPVVLPGETRSAIEGYRNLLNELRSALVDQHPAADAPPARLSRFSARTVLMVTLGIVALWLLLGTLNFQQIAAAVRTAQPALIALAFGVGLLMHLGAAMTLIAFSPTKLGLWRTTLVQVAGALVSIVAPAGVGPSAINLRFLATRRIKTPLALATVALTQVSQVGATVVLLVGVALVTGSVGQLSLPTGSVTIIITVIGVVGAVIAVVPPARNWVWRLVGPTLQQVWPRLLWVVGSPVRLLIGVSGNLLMTVSQLATFYLVLAAFGYHLDLTTLAITFLTSNAVGSAVPSPGGVGPVEAALTAGLTVAGVPAGVAFSAALVFRVLTFWGRAPLGWLAMRHLQRRGDL